MKTNENTLSRIYAFSSLLICDIMLSLFHSTAELLTVYRLNRSAIKLCTNAHWGVAHWAALLSYFGTNGIIIFISIQLET